MPNRTKKIAYPFFLFATILIGAAYCLMNLGNPAKEKEARRAITKLGGITVLDSIQKRVGTLNLQLIKGEPEIQQAMKLVFDLTNLQVLDASRTLLSDQDLAPVEGLSKLNSLHLNNTQLTNAGLKHIVPLKQLYGLHVAHTSINDEGLAEIAELQGLVHLDLSGNDIGAGISKLNELPKLTWLLIQEIEIDASLLEALGELSQIKRLTIGSAESKPELVKELHARLPGASID